jgi:hypothetical protein
MRSVVPHRVAVTDSDPKENQQTVNVTTMKQDSLETGSLAYAASLFLQGFPVTLKLTDRSAVTFVFPHSQGIAEAYARLTSGTERVEPLEYTKAYTSLRRAMFRTLDAQRETLPSQLETSNG